MNTTEMLEVEALNFLRRLDTAAYEAFTHGDVTGDDYRAMAKQIATIQQLAVNVLSGIDGTRNSDGRDALR